MALLAAEGAQPAGAQEVELVGLVARRIELLAAGQGEPRGLALRALLADMDTTGDWTRALRSAAS